MRIVHLSDFHLNNRNIKDMSAFVTKALIADLKDYNNDMKIDLILFSGDLIDKGGTSFDKKIDEAFITFEEVVINPVLISLELDKSNFIFAPGNHDIDRSADSKNIEDGLKNNLTSTNAVIEHIDSGKTEGINRILPFKRFEREFHSDQLKGITNYQSCYVSEIGGKKVGITAFNTAWRCYDSDKDYKHIILGVRQISDASKFIENCEVKIALLHHQFDCLEKFDCDVVQPLIEREYDMIFCGHIHEGSSFSRNSVLGDIFVSIAPTNSGGNLWNNDQRYINGYSIIDYDFNTRTCTVHNRIYSYRQGGYVANTQLAPNNGIGVFYKKEQYNVYKKPELDLNKTEKPEPNFNKDTEMGNILNSFNPSDYSASNFQIKNNNMSYKFAKNIDLFKKYSEEISSQSLIFKGVVESIDTLVFLMDRLLYKINVEDYTEICCTIDNLDKSIGEIANNNKSIHTASLFKLVEWWLIEICQSLNIHQNLDVFNLDEIFNSLINEVKNIDNDDIIEELLKSTKRNINYINQGNTVRLSLQSSFAIIGGIITSLILPIHINKHLVIETTAGRNNSEIVSEELSYLIDAVRNEYSSHLLGFKGRENEIIEILQSITEYKFIIIKGQKEVGKSAMISKALSGYSNDKFKGEFSSLFALFSFKHSKSIPEMVGAIVEQCNTNLINKVDTETLDKIIKENIQQEHGIIEEKESLIIAKYQILKTYLTESIKRVIEECGKIFLVIDSLEFIDQQADRITFLLQDIPDNCHVLLCTGEKGECVKWIIDNANLCRKVIRLNCILRNDIPLISGLNDESIDNKNINDKIFEKSKGQISYIRKFLEQVRGENNGIDISALEYLEENAVSDFEKDAELCIDNDILEETLLLLSVFEQIQPLSLEYIQQFLSYKNISYRMPKIKSELKKLDNQISDLRFKRIRLISSDFAKFVLERFFSTKDVDEFISTVFDWLSNSTYLSIEFTCKYIIHMQHSWLISVEKYEINITKFICSLVKLENHTRLFDIGFYLFYEVEDNEGLALQFLDKASDMNNLEAKSFLGYIYSHGEKVDKDIIKAEKLLKNASDMNSMRAKRILGTLLLDGTEISKNVEEGQKLLEEAMLLGSKSAKLDLSIRLILGRDIPANIKRGQQLMNELAEEEHVDAMRIMGNRYLYGAGLSRDIGKGKYLLKKAIDKGDNYSKFVTAKYLITNSELKQDILEGIKYIEELVKANNLEAKKFYSQIMIVGLGIEKDCSKGISLLKELAEDGDQESKLEYSKILIEGAFDLQDIGSGKEILNNLVKEEYTNAVMCLGDMLIEGKYFDKDIETGINLLYKAADSGNLLSKRKLAFRFIYGLDVQKDFFKGEQLYKEAMTKGDVVAKYQYAKALLTKNDISETGRTEALDLLKEAAFLGNSDAKRYLGVSFLNGKIVDKDINKGLEYLNEAVSLNNPHAMRELGYRLMFGIDISKDSDRAEKLLRKSIDLEDDLAKTILGHGIILGEFDTVDISEGCKLLEEASADEPNAMRILAIMFIEGMFVEKDKKRGEELLRKAIVNGDNIATLHLARLLLDGKFLTQNIAEGKKLLTELAEDEDESAIIELSNRLIDGEGFEKNVHKGLELLEKLSHQGIIEAKYEYAFRLITGENVIKNIKKGEQLLREAEAKGHESSRRFLAQCLIDETLEQKDEKEGIKLIEKSVSANDPLAMRYLGDLLIEGIYIVKDIKRAIQLYEKSIQGRDYDCKVSYALKLLIGDLIPKDKAKGLSLLNDAAKNGNMRAKCELAKLSIEGSLIEKDLDKGLKTLNELIEDGYDKAKYFLASALIYGERIDKDTQKGIWLFEDLVNRDNLTATIEYAELLIEGVYIPKDIDKGEKLLRSLSQKGDMDACYILAVRYLTGDGLKKQVKNGKERLIKAANSLPMAMIEYGIRLKKGNKFPKDEIKGKNYIDKAIKNATTDCLHNLGVTAYQLDDHELATQLFWKAYENGSSEAGTSLAYMLRRDETRGSKNLPSMFSLLERGLFNNYDTSTINLVLTLVKNEKSDNEWGYADFIIRSLDKCAIAAKWWYNIANKNDDAEGHLIVGWLVKHKKISDPNYIQYKERLNKVLEKGWYIPQWLFEDNNTNASNIIKKHEAIIKLVSDNINKRYEDQKEG